jgi:hypothetical protein
MGGGPNPGGPGGGPIGGGGGPIGGPKAGGPGGEPKPPNPGCPPNPGGGGGGPKPPPGGGGGGPNPPWSGGPPKPGGGGGGPNPPWSGAWPKPGGGGAMPKPGGGGGGPPNAGGPSGDAQIGQYLSAGVAGAPQRGQIMFTLLVKTERRPPVYDAGNASRGPRLAEAPWSTPGAYRAVLAADQEEVSALARQRHDDRPSRDCASMAEPPRVRTERNGLNRAGERPASTKDPGGLGGLRPPHRDRRALGPHHRNADQSLASRTRAALPARPRK